jgi:hypothetical protein
VNIASGKFSFLILTSKPIPKCLEILLKLDFICSFAEILGKIRKGFSGAHFPYNGKELVGLQYKVFCGIKGGMEQVDWHSASGGGIPDYSTAPGVCTPVTLGCEYDPAYDPQNPYRPLYAARATVQGALTPGDITYSMGGAHIPWSGQEIVVPNYEVLVYTQCSI